MYTAISILIKLLEPTPLAQRNTTIYELPSHLVSDLSMNHVQVLILLLYRS